MNVLLCEVKRSLLELAKGLGGQLHKTPEMEDLQTALAKNEVKIVICPGDNLAKSARPTLRKSYYQVKTHLPHIYVPIFVFYRT